MPAPSWQLGEEEWNALRDGSACPFCSRVPRGIIASLPGAHVTMDPSVNVTGYCCVIARVHANELHEMDEPAALQFMQDVRRVGYALQSITGAIKLNYEIHGNVIPHVHMHIIPRYRGDAIETQAVPFASVTASPYATGEFDELRDAMTKALS